MDEETLRLTASKLAKSLLFILNSNIREGGIAAMMMAYQKKEEAFPPSATPLLCLNAV